MLEVHPSSPAEIAGFIPFSDYIIGSPEGSLQSESALGEMVEQVSRSLTYSEHKVPSAAPKVLGLQFNS